MEEEGGIPDRLSQDMLRMERQRRYLNKRSEEEQALEAVFDRRTLFTVYSMINRGIIDYLNGVVQSGKEARVYWGVRKGTDVAVKIFYTGTSSFKKRMPYISGDPRFADAKKYGLGMIYEWVRKEYRNLRQAREAGVRVPEPYHCEKNVLVMQFIGEGGVPAPTLANLRTGTVSDYKSLVSTIVKLYKDAGLVHGDLSEFNVFKYKGELIVFDFASAVDTRHPMAREFLLRDIENVNRFFAKVGVKVSEPGKILKRVGLE